MARRPSPDEVPVTKPDKVLWPGLEVTKRAYVDYLLAVAPRMLPWLEARPLTMIRAPDGVTGERYFQKSAPTYAPDWVRTVTIAAPSAKRDVDYVVCSDASTLVWLGNQAVLEFHPAPVREDSLERPDLLLVDLDPPDGGFEQAVEVARLTLEVLEDLGLPAGVKTTGGSGLHVVAPIERRYDARALRSAASELTRIVASRAPDLVTAEFRKADRGDRVMLDPSRNAPGATFVAPYSPRTREVGAVSFPIVPEDLGKVRNEDRTLVTALEHLDDAGPRAWDALLGSRSRLPARLRVETAAFAPRGRRGPAKAPAEKRSNEPAEERDG
jgi:bifunctional non-homologous end joining protein LigD